MPLPAAWNLIAITGTYIDGDTGNPSTGRVLFNGMPTVTVSGVTVTPRDYVGYLNASGQLKDISGAAFYLPSTDDPDIAPTGWAWRVTEQMDGARAPFHIFVPYNGGAIDLLTVAPVASGLQPSPYVALVNATLGIPVVGDYVLGNHAGAARLFPTGPTNGVLLATDLAASGGSALIGYQIAGGAAETLAARLAASVNILDFGAGVGKTAAQNRVAIQAAFDANAGVHRAVLIPPGEFIVDGPPALSDYLHVLLFGTIRNSQAGHTADSCALSMGSYNNISAASLTLYTCLNTAAGALAEGATTFTLDSGSNRTNGIAALPVGTTAYIRSQSYAVIAGANVPTYVGLHRITAADGTTGILTFEPPVDEAIVIAQIAAANAPGIAVDTYSRGLYAVYRSSITGPGALVSDAYFPLARGGRLECTMDVGVLKGRGGFFGNLFCHSVLRARTVQATLKIQDVAMNSNNSLVEVQSAFCDSADGSGSGMLYCGNENNRKMTYRYGSISAPNFTGASALVVFGTGGHDCIFDANYLYAPLATGSNVLFSNIAQTVSGDQIQHTTRDCSIAIREFVGGAGSRYVRCDNSGGQLYRCGVRYGRFTGAVSSAAMLLEGTDNYILKDVRCESGALNVSNLAVNFTCDGAFFASGIAFTGGATLANCNVRNLRSTQSLLLRAAYATGQAVTTSSTTANNPITGGTVTVAAAAINAGDVLYFKFSGTVTGATDAKTIAVYDAKADGSSSAALLTISFAAADTGTFRGEGTFTISGNTVYSGVASGWKGSTLTDARISRTGLGMTADGRQLILEGWVANAADSITFDQFTLGIRRAAVDVP